MYHYLWVM